MIEQENERVGAMPSYQILQTMVRRQIDQMFRTRNWRPQKETVETGIRWKVSARMLSVEATGQSSSADSCSFSHGSIVDRMHNCPLLLSRRRRILKGESPPKKKSPRKYFCGPRRDSLCEGKGQNLKGICTYLGISYVKKYMSESRCTCGDKCRFRHCEVLKESIQLGCVSHDGFPRKYCTWKGENESNDTVNFTFMTTETECIRPWEKDNQYAYDVVPQQQRTCHTPKKKNAQSRRICFLQSVL